MTSNALTLRPRTAPAVSPAATTSTTNALPERLQLANAIAGAGDMIPVCYRNKPGAVALVSLWAEANEVDLFTAMQNIYPIQGRPFVAAELRVVMATRKGFEIETIRSDRTVCEIQVWRGTVDEGERRGSPIIVAIGEIPDHLTKNANWRNHPDDMLFATAIRKADRRHIKTACAYIDSAQDFEQLDPVAVIAQANHDHAERIDDDETVEAEVLDDDEVVEIQSRTAEAPGGITNPTTLEGFLERLDQAGVKHSSALTAARKQFPDRKGDLTNIEAVYGDPAAMDFILGQIEETE